MEPPPNFEYDSENNQNWYDWDYLSNLFMQSPRFLEFYCIDFRLTSTIDIEQLMDKKALPLAKPSGGGVAYYTGAFFCRNDKDWFIYRVIYALPRSIREGEYKRILKTLESGAAYQMYQHKKTKNPFKYLANIDPLK